MPNTLNLEQVMEACEQDDCLGFCLSCGQEAYGVEPDARNYECQSCSQLDVFGADEILLQGLVS